MRDTSKDSKFRIDKLSAQQWKAAGYNPMRRARGDRGGTVIEFKEHKQLLGDAAYFTLHESLHNFHLSDSAYLGDPDNQGPVELEVDRIKGLTDDVAIGNVDSYVWLVLGQ